MGFGLFCCIFFFKTARGVLSQRRRMQYIIEHILSVISNERKLTIITNSFLFELILHVQCVFKMHISDFVSLNIVWDLAFTLCSDLALDFSPTIDPGQSRYPWHSRVHNRVSAQNQIENENSKASTQIKALGPRVVFHEAN